MGRMLQVMFLSLSLLAAPVCLASQTDRRLDTLFARLKSAQSDAEAASITQLIWEIWQRSENDTVNRLMSEGVEQMAARNYSAALSTFSQVVEAEPYFAEGWNKRATVYYLMGEYESSIRDVERTLALEPRHFGALSGLGLIFLALGNDSAALKAFEKALQVNPHMPGARAHVAELRKRILSRSF